jgi:aminopeptidase-like protein
MLEIIKELIKYNIQLVGEGYNKAIKYINNIISLEVIEIPSGTKLGTWTVPNEWIVKKAWVKFNGEKIIDYEKDKFSLMVYSQPFKGKLTRDEFKSHLYNSTDKPDATPYVYSFYEPKWGVCMPKNRIFDTENKDLLPEGEYEVCIDTEFKPSIMEIGVHTIKGKTNREILLFAHLDHAYQANDNLSGVACLIDLAKKLENKYEHTIKIVFCPETIGSIGYALTQDISKVDFMIALDIVGNDNNCTLQYSFDIENKLNKIAHLAMMSCGENFSMNQFRATIGSDEYVFNDPLIGIPGLMITRHPYKEYHTSADTIDIIKEDKMLYVQKVIENIIDTYEKDYIPLRKFKGPLMRSRYNVQAPVKSINMQLDYLIYNINGKRYLSEILDDLQLNWKYCYELLEKLVKDEYIVKKYDSRINARKVRKHKTSK